MPEITRRRTGEMLRKLFEILMPTPDGMRARDALAELEKHLTLSDYEKGVYATGGRRFDKIVRFATVDLVKQPLEQLWKAFLWSLMSQLQKHLNKFAITVRSAAIAIN